MNSTSTMRKLFFPLAFLSISPVVPPATSTICPKASLSVMLPFKRIVILSKRFLCYRIYISYMHNIRMLLVKTPGCCYPKHPDVVRTKIYTFAYL